LKILCAAVSTIKGKEGAIPATIGTLSRYNGRQVRLYACVIGLVHGEVSQWGIEDGEASAIIDTSNLENVSLQKGNWYRFIGEVAGTAVRGVPAVTLIIHPHQVDGYSGVIYTKCIMNRDRFIGSIDTLVGHATQQ
jgi:hypothetical protein